MPPPSLKLPPARGFGVTRRRVREATARQAKAAKSRWFQRAKGQALYGISTTNEHEMNTNYPD